MTNPRGRIAVPSGISEVEARSENVPSVNSPGEKNPAVAFDPDRVIDTSTYDDPRRDPEGILHVFVNGRHAVEDGRLLEANAGRVLRRGAPAGAA
jgi:N-acyl-D-aspartate/D-glutamate deacylase